MATKPRKRTAQAAADEAVAAAEESKQAARTSTTAAGVAVEAAVEDDDPLLDTAVRQLEAGVTDEKPFGEPGAPLAPRSPFRIAFYATFGVALAWTICQAVIAARQVLILLLISAFLAIGLNPPVEALQRRGLPRRRAVAIVIGAVLTFFVAFGLAVVPPIASQAGDFVQDLPNRIEQLQENRTVQDLDERFGLLEEAKRAATDLAREGGTRALGGVIGVGKVVLSTTFSTFTVLILTLYFLSSFPGMKRAAYRLVPRSRRARVGLLADEILNRVGGYVAGALTIAAVAGFTSAVFLSVVGVPFSIALAMVIALLDLIPLVGATIGAAVATLVAFTVSPTVGLVTLAFYVAYQQIENYVIYPKVMKRTVDVSPAATIVAILIGAALLGILGALLAIPVAAAIQLIGSEVVVPRQDQA